MGDMAVQIEHQKKKISISQIQNKTEGSKLSEEADALCRWEDDGGAVLKSESES